MVRLLRFRTAAFLPAVAFGLVVLLGGCVVYPDREYGYHPAPYYPAPVVQYGYGGWGHGGHRGW